MKKTVVSLLILMAFICTAAFGELTTVVVKNPDNMTTRIFYSGGKEVARQVKDTKGNVTKTTGKIPDGVVKEFNDNGKLLVEWNYKNGNLQGESKEYFMSGELLEEILYKNNKREGISKKYYKSGKLLAERNFKNDKLEGPTRMYYENGKLFAELNYKDGKLEGETKVYYESGKLKTVETYKNSQKTRTKSYDPQGKVLMDLDYTSKQNKTATTTIKQLKNTATDKAHK